MSSVPVLVLCVVSLLFLWAFGAQAETSTGRARIAPSVARLDPGQTCKFKVVMLETRLDGAKMAEDVTWAVNDIPGGDDTVGRITVEGVYTAPATAPSPKEVHICAEVPAAVNRHLWATVLIKANGPDYEMVWEWGESVSEPEYLKDPHCIAQDRDGNLIIADYWGSRVLRFTPDGKYLGDLGLGTGEGPGFVIKPRVVGSATSS